MVELTAEQQAKIEENRRNALKRLLEKKAAVVAAPVIQPSPPPRHFKLRLELDSLTTFAAPRVHELRSLFLSVKGNVFRQQDNRWVFPLDSYSALMQLIRDRYPEAELYPIPDTVIKYASTATPISVSIDSMALQDLFLRAQSLFQQDKHYKKSPPAISTLIDEKLQSHLLPFQIASIYFALERSGRILLADEMGLGKTLQALAMASCYRKEWPMLIIAPASLVSTWSEAIKEWLPSIPISCIWTLYNSASLLDYPPFSGLINIVSYDLAVKHEDLITSKSFRVIIFDESHVLRNDTTKRCKILLPIAKRASRLFLLSGTPALSRPIELFTQLQALRGDLFSNKVLFGTRYCSGFKTNYGWDFRGSSHCKELSVLLEHSVMIRRLKSQVLTQLPPKRRQQVFLYIEDEDLQRSLEDKRQTTFKALMEKNSSILHGPGLLQNKELYLTLWSSTGLVKSRAIQQYLMDLLESLDESNKVLLFAHHKQVLDAIEETLTQADVGIIRIDGSTGSAERQKLCNLFQTSSKVRVALLSITAAGVGLTLTAASIVLMAELFWNPGVLMQAEDRAHRIGQAGNHVDVRYLLAKGTMDDILWPLLLRKLTVLEQVGLTEQSGDFSHMRQEGQEIQTTLLDYLYVPTDSTVSIP